MQSLKFAQIVAIGNDHFQQVNRLFNHSAGITMPLDYAGRLGELRRYSLSEPQKLNIASGASGRL